jgi:hypothetical protein
MAGALVVEDDPVHLVDHHDADRQVFEGVGDEAAHVALVLGGLADDADALLQRVGGREAGGALGQAER